MEEPKNNSGGREIVISLRDLHKSFGENQVLKGIDLDVFQKENMVVLGRSGTGKSVLIKIVCGLLKPDSGVVNVLGKEVDQLNDRDLRELRLKVGFSFQSSALYDSMTVRENNPRIHISSLDGEQWNGKGDWKFRAARRLIKHEERAQN